MAPQLRLLLAAAAAAAPAARAACPVGWAGTSDASEVCFKAFCEPKTHEEAAS
eukprot:gene5064-8063_t